MGLAGINATSYLKVAEEICNRLLSLRAIILVPSEIFTLLTVFTSRVADPGVVGWRDQRKI